MNLTNLHWAFRIEIRDFMFHSLIKRPYADNNFFVWLFFVANLPHFLSIQTKGNERRNLAPGEPHGQFRRAPCFSLPHFKDTATVGECEGRKDKFGQNQIRVSFSYFGWYILGFSSLPSLNFFFFLINFFKKKGLSILVSLANKLSFKGGRIFILFYFFSIYVWGNS